jgi:hypothetical protein
MARPLKEGLDYFPLDIDFDQDDKLVVPIAKYGMQGLGVILKIMMNIYRNGYFYPWEEREQYALSSKVNVDINSVKEVVNECINWGFFNRKVFEEHKVLTSRGFQKRYIEAAKRRKSISLLIDLMLIDPNEECKKVAHSLSIVNADGNPINVYNNPDKCNPMSTISTQSKVKESKGKKEDIKPLCDDPPSADPPTDNHHPDFQRFWEVFPKNRRRDKAKAYETWKKKVKVSEREDLIRCTVAYAKDFKTIGKDGSYAKMPTTYLNAGTYKDYLEGGTINEDGERPSGSTGKYSEFVIE